VKHPPAEQRARAEKRRNPLGHSPGCGGGGARAKVVLPPAAIRGSRFRGFKGGTLSPWPTAGQRVQGEPPRESIGDLLKRLGPRRMGPPCTPSPCPSAGASCSTAINAQIGDFVPLHGRVGGPWSSAGAIAVPLGAAVLPTWVTGGARAGFLFSAEGGPAPRWARPTGAIVLGAALGYALGRPRRRRPRPPAGCAEAPPLGRRSREALLESGFWRALGVGGAGAAAPSTPYALTNLVMAAAAGRR